MRHLQIPDLQEGALKPAEFGIRSWPNHALRADEAKKVGFRYEVVS